MQRLEILAIANLIALMILLILKLICFFGGRKITRACIYLWLKSKKKRLKTKAPQENEYFVLCCKADKKFLKKITDKNFSRITVTLHDERTQEKIEKGYKVDINITAIDS